MQTDAPQLIPVSIAGDVTAVDRSGENTVQLTIAKNVRDSQRTFVVTCQRAQFDRAPAPGNFAEVQALAVVLSAADVPGGLDLTTNYVARSVTLL